MPIQTLIFVIVAIVLAMAVAGFQYYFRVKLRSKITIVLFLLRVFGVFFLLLLFINPKFEKRIVETLKPVLTVAIDNSTSIKYFNKEIEVKGFIEKLQDDTTLNEKFDIRYFKFGKKLNPLDSLLFNEVQTDLSNPFSHFNELYKDHVTPVILLSDGNQTVGSDYEHVDFKQPVYPVIVGDTSRYTDIRITRVNHNRYAYLKNKFPVEVFVHYEGGEPVSKRLTVKQGSKIVYSKRLNFTKEENFKEVFFYLPATKLGRQNYNMEIEQLTDEKNIQNNVRAFAIEVLDQRRKIVVISSITHPDLGMIKRSLENKNQFDVSIEYIDNLKTKVFENKLLVLYQPTHKFKNIFERLQNTNGNYFIITGKQTDWTFLNTIQDDFSKKTLDQNENYLADFNPEFSSLQLEDFDFSGLPPLEDKFGNITMHKTHETLLYQKIGNYSTKDPLLAILNSRKSKRAMLFGENLWKWRMAGYLEKNSHQSFDEFFGKLMQYLSSKENHKRLSLDYDPYTYVNEEFVITANYVDNNYEFDPRARIWLSLINKETNETKKYGFNLKGNNYYLNLTNLQSGNYEFNVVVENQNIKSKGRVKILDFEVERQFTNANIDKLTRIAIHSEGKVFFPNQIQELKDVLLQDKRFASVQKSFLKEISLINWKWMLIMALFVFGLEWFLRKYHGEI